jgi:broad specificity polyphosphatase/5'/3'-nucleotidase SurE
MYNEAQALKNASYEVSVICPKGEQSDVSKCLLSRLEE